MPPRVKAKAMPKISSNMPPRVKAKAMPKRIESFGLDDSVHSSLNPLIIATRTTKELKAELQKADWKSSLMTRTKKAELVERVKDLRAMQLYTKKETKCGDADDAATEGDAEKQQKTLKVDDKADGKMKKLMVDD